ncbi:MAG: PcfJ domain-containing protein [Firmicutes bacterium]|nr:PcfJ domain-containing protein [Bacillota bacterium]
MKKKAIERIEFLGLPKVSRKRGVNFVCMTAVKNVAHERHLFLEVYRNNKESRKAPIVRIVLTRKDFGTYFPADGTWSRAQIESDEYYSTSLIWDQQVHSNRKTKETENILYTAADFEKMKRFFNDESRRYIEYWWEYIKSKERDILCLERNRRNARRYERRQQALQDRIANTPKLPEQEILSWAAENLFQKNHYLYYRKKGPRAEICCSACGGVTEGRWKAGDTYESEFEKHIAEPKDKCTGSCPMCGVPGIYKPQGMAKRIYTNVRYVYKADRYKETGAVIRYIQLEKNYELLESSSDAGKLHMEGAREILEGVEIARTYINDGKTQTDYCKYDWVHGKDFWDDCNLYGMSNITLEAAPLYPGFSDSLKGTCLQYSAIELYAAEVGKVKVRNYLEEYLKFPQIEMLVKLKLYGVVEEMICYDYGIVKESKADRADRFLGIRKERLKMLITHRGDKDILSILQVEKRMEQSWTESQILALAELNVFQKDIEQVCRIMTLQKALNLIAKYAGCAYGSGCSYATDRLRETAQTYFDYISMREERGYDMSNTVYQRPRNLMVAHNKMVEEQNREEWEKRKSEVEKRYPLIRRSYRKLRNRFLYEDNDFIIRPARSAAEIVREGRILHHCVGLDNYLYSHNKQISIILMLRKKKEPEIPYITAEVRVRDGKIIQWFGAHDKKPANEAQMQKWLNAYETRLKCEKPVEASEAKAGTECLAAGA